MDRDQVPAEPFGRQDCIPATYLSSLSIVIAARILLQFYLLLFLLLSGCALPGYGVRNEVVRDEKFVPGNWKVLGVLPFTGSVAYNSPAGEFFAFQMQKKTNYQIIGPAAMQMALARSGIHLSPEETSTEDAHKVADFTGTQALFIGKITTHSFPIHAIAEVRLIDAGTGQVVATAVQSSYARVFTYRMDEHIQVSTAIELAAAELLAVLEEFSKKRATGKES